MKINAAVVLYVPALYIPWTTNEFRGWKISQFAGLIRYVGKSFVIFSITMHLHTFMVFQLHKKSYERFNKSFAFLTWILLKTVISILRNGREYITDAFVCTFHAFQDDHAVTGEELQLKRWSKSLTASLLASSACYFLISWQKPSRFSATTVEYFLEYFKFFMVSTFSGAKV